MPVTVALKAAAALALGYLSGSVNYAILVTRLVLRQDIRELGNKNPGTANVARNVGKGWAALVFFADLLKVSCRCCWCDSCCSRSTRPWPPSSP